ncbi:hypothetical protein P43SY_008388 [Pythium insidiosum]|uniref:HTH CENPB-type domain-containing protein n=1 Tax=Pythium insidiosum TaxID=114742 RepID=A0AAD5Q598_PYTIN|nr:hypothetical protein P43SY_008388 [Pythium insidiosum]
MRDRRRGTATSLSAEDEERIVLWINALRKDGIPVSSQMLRLKASEIALEVGLAGFEGTWSWRRGFMKRHKMSIRMRTRQGQVTGEEANVALASFTNRVRQRMHDKGVVKLYNADQTGVFFEYLPKHTIDKTGSKTIWMRCAGKDKERLSAMLLGDSEGNKYEPFVVIKAKSSTIPARQVENDSFRHGFGRRVWSDIAPLHDTTNLQIYGNPKAWWNESLSLAFLNFHFGHRKETDPPVMLLWDHMSAHWTDKVKAYAAAKRVLLEEVPARFTFCLQPADIAWNRPLKDRLRAHWIEYLREAVRSNKKITPPHRNQVMQWVNDAWSSLTSATIKNGFVKCGLAARDGETMGELGGFVAVPDDPDTVADAVLVAALQSRRAFDGVAARRDTLDSNDEEDDSDDGNEGSPHDEECGDEVGFEGPGLAGAGDDEATLWMF